MKSKEEIAVWEKLIAAARKIHGESKISPFIEAGSVSAALMTEKGNIYTGVCIDTACGLGMCAERSAIAAMISAGEHEIKKILCIMPDGSCGGTPCGACREFMMQLSADAPDIEVLTDTENFSTVALGEMVPDWWGKKYIRLRETHEKI